MNFKYGVGERVKTSKNYKSAKYRGTIIHCMPGANGNLYAVELEGVPAHTKTFYEIELDTLIPTHFHVGDHIDIPILGITLGVITSTILPNNYIIESGKGLSKCTYVFKESFMQMNANIILSSPQPLYNSGYIIPTAPLGDLQYSITKHIPKILTNEKSVCHHDMKAYLGMNERFNYCTKCNHKESV